MTINTQFVEVKNQAGLTENYNQFLSTIIDNVYPALTNQRSKESHESLLGIVVGCIVIAAAAVAAAQEYLGPLMASAMLGSGATAVAGAAVTAASLSTSGAIVSAITTGVLAGMASAAEQGFAVNVGWQPHFSLAEAVDTGAETAASLGVSGGIPTAAFKLGMTTQEAFNAVAEDVYKFGMLAASDMLIQMSTGITKQFDFKSLVSDMASQMAAAGLDGSVFGKPTTATSAIEQNFVQNQANAAITGGINKAILGIPFSAKDLAAQALGTTIGTALGTQIADEMNAAGNQNNGKNYYNQATQSAVPVGTSAAISSGYSPTMFGAGNTSGTPTLYTTVTNPSNSASQTSSPSANPATATTSVSATSQVAPSTNQGVQSSANILGATCSNLFGGNLDLPASAIQTALGNVPAVPQQSSGTNPLPYYLTAAAAKQGSYNPLISLSSITSSSISQFGGNNASMYIPAGVQIFSNSGLNSQALQFEAPLALQAEAMPRYVDVSGRLASVLSPIYNGLSDNFYSDYLDNSASVRNINVMNAFASNAEAVTSLNNEKQALISNMNIQSSLGADLEFVGNSMRVIGNLAPPTALVADTISGLIQVYEEPTYRNVATVSGGIGGGMGGLYVGEQLVLGATGEETLAAAALVLDPPALLGAAAIMGGLSLYGMFSGRSIGGNIIYDEGAKLIDTFKNYNALNMPH